MPPLEAGMEFFQGVHLHVSALIAGTVVGGCGDELLARALLLQPMKHTHFSGNNEGTGFAASAEVDHFFSGTNFICQHAHGACAFRMSDQKGIRVFFPDGQNTVSGEFDVGVAVTLP